MTDIGRQPSRLQTGALIRFDIEARVSLDVARDRGDIHDFGRLPVIPRAII
jgi:hypothetical protein